jgi:hypothetical protein
VAEAFAPLVGLAGVLVMIGAIGWMISPGFRAWVKFKAMRVLFVLALVVVAIGLFTYDWK